MWPIVTQKTLITELILLSCLFFSPSLYVASDSHKYLYLTDFRASKKARFHGSEEEYEMEEDISGFQNDECQFDDLCGDETFNRETITKPGIESGSWGLLDGRVLARIFHFLKADVKSLAYAALTCKHWRSTVKIYKGISSQVDLLSVASSCTDSTMLKIMVCFCFHGIGLLISSPTSSLTTIPTSGVWGG